MACASGGVRDAFLGPGEAAHHLEVAVRALHNRVSSTRESRRARSARLTTALRIGTSQARAREAGAG